jgi:hypothetical protein
VGGTEFFHAFPHAVSCPEKFTPAVPISIIDEMLTYPRICLLVKMVIKYAEIVIKMGQNRKNEPVFFCNEEVEEVILNDGMISNVLFL